MECNLLEVGIHEFQKLRASLGDTSHSEELVSDMVWSSTTSVVEVGSWFTFPVVILQWVWYILIPDMICILLYWYIYIYIIYLIKYIHADAWIYTLHSFSGCWWLMMYMSRIVKGGRTQYTVCATWMQFWSILFVYITGRHYSEQIPVPSLFATVTNRRGLVQRLVQTQELPGGSVCMQQCAGKRVRLSETRPDDCRNLKGWLWSRLVWSPVLLPRTS